MKWNLARLGTFGFLLGTIFMGMMVFSHPNSPLALLPIVTAILAGLMNAVVFTGAAISRNRFVTAMAKFTD